MAEKRFDQFELWGTIVRQNGHLRRNNWVHWAAHVAVGSALLLLVTRPPVAIRVDRLGSAELVDTGGAIATQPTPEEAEHVARLFAIHVLEVTSGSVARDIQRAFELMTVSFERAYREKLKDDPVPGVIDRANVRTALTFRDNATEIKAEKDPSGRIGRYFVTLHARMDLFRADVLTSPMLSRDFLLRTTLLVVPRTKRSLNGLLVDFFEKTVVDGSAPSLETNPLATVPAATSGGAR